jgi:cell division septation protein DedD
MKRYFLILLFFSFTGLFAQEKEKAKPVKPAVPADFCITSDALILFNMINDYRRSNNLPLIPLSRSLCYVASTHASDLRTSNSVSNGCGLQSWSSNGNWKPCCYAKDPSHAACMSNKPKELTGYPGSGYEIAYWDEEKATPSGAIELWRSTVIAQNVLLNRDKWQSKQWKAMGVALLQGYAIVWLGDKTDAVADLALCGTDSLVQKGKAPLAAANVEKKAAPVKKTVSEKPVSPEAKKVPDPAKIKEIPTEQQPDGTGTRFFIIVASMRDENTAKEEVIQLQKRGFTQAAIQKGENVYRITVGEFTNRDDAQKRRDELASEFKGIWILRQ